MMPRREISAVLAGLCVALASCSAAGHGGPAGWTKVNATTWVQGSGPAQQRYVTSSAAFGGSLKDLASQETINVILRYPGAHFVSSIPLADCPAQAGLATFRSPKQIVEAAFSVQNGQAVTILYSRPAGTEPSKDVAPAMSAALCVV
jgi:hypothetical protein